MAFDQGELEPESDIGLSAESQPDFKDKDIRKITFKVAMGEPLIDGHINEEFWEQAELFDLNIELYPDRLAPAVVETKALVAATKTHLYAAFTADDPNPKKIRSALREHDAIKKDDYVSIIIDPTGAKAKKYEFRVNPHGTMSDVLQDTISDRYIYDWDTEWEGAAQITDKGYTVELAIPATAINVPAHDDPKVPYGIVILKRAYPRSADRTLATFFVYNRTARKLGGTADVLSAVDERAEDKDIPGMSPRLRLKSHYIYHLDEKRSIGGKFEQNTERDLHSFGLDAVYHFSTSNKLAVTINPNFTEVEADITKQSINNPFTIFQPEKRDVFKPVTEYYQSLLPVVYTRNIIQPEVGFSFISADAINSFGTFVTNDKKTEVIIPDNLGSDKVSLSETSYSASFRFRRSKGQQTSGIIGTYRSADGYHNATIGYDGLLNFGIDDKMRYHILFSDTRQPKRFAADLCEEEGCTDEQPSEECPLGDCPVNAQVLRTNFGKSVNGHALKIQYKHDGPNGLYWLGYEQASPDFRADLGFYRRIDIRSLDVAIGKKWYLKALRQDEGKSRIRVYAIGNYIRSFEYNDLLEQAVSFWGEFRGSLQSLIRVGWRLRERAVNRINQATLETGRNAPLFDENYLQWNFETSPLINFKLNFDGRYGKIADADNMVIGDMLEIKPIVTYRYGSVEFTASGTFRDYEVNDKRLYREQFLSFTAIFRNSRHVSHRLLYLDDLSERDIERWMGDELEKEIERTFEYTLTYYPGESWKILTGIKLGHDFESDINDGDITNQQFYFKIEKTL